ncbi:hypothetical protein KXD40_006353 [Peronospora effusa]|uniref:non-specific serine/threonine protein kinase n=1 Tax=Peronospora effusa TaxID=542832 RepID=A0A3M6VU73_9STRA|nr:hypothetical protein DD238_002059 [Peronospora effusa]RQM10622.1 hypothetical protein DD237_002871 [Peronospora effusa]UIZ25612.1 hypothetical protein KXD40_006353 [Peronospora effusa]
MPSSCTRSQTVLTSDCNSLCPEGRPCVAYTAEDEDECSSSTSTFGNCTSDDYCAYECFATGPNDFGANGAIDFSTYTFLIPFGSDVEPYERGSRDQEVAVNAKVGTVDLTSKYPSKSNEVLQHIEPLDFRTSTTGIVLAGGSSVFGVRGKVVKMQLPRELFTADTQLQTVTLANFGLKQILESSLPSGLVNLTISNCLMTSYPKDLQVMSELKHLDLSTNYFEFFPSDLELPRLQTLNLSANSLASFEGSLPSLVTLDISHNNFTSIPAAIFGLKDLRRLDLQENQFTDVMLTTSQFKFLQKLTELKVDSFGKVACNTTETLQTSNSSISVCVSDTKLPSNKALIAGIMAATLVLFVVIVLIFVFRLLHRRALSTKFEPKIISLHRELLSPIKEAPLSPSLSSSDSLDVKYHPQRFPYEMELEALLLNADDLDYIRKLPSKHRPDRDHREAFLTRFRGSRFLVCKRLQRKFVNDTSEVQRFAKEIHLAAFLDHPRIVALVGILWSRVYSLEALFEYMDGGNLRSYLAEVKNAEGLRSWRSQSIWKLQVAFDTAEALAYAHSFSPTLVHRALTSHSVLLSSPPELHAGLDNFVYEHQEVTNMSTYPERSLEARWLPPEVITGSADYSPAADMYALGVILSEIDTHSLPYENAKGVVGMNDMEILNLVASGKLHPVFTFGCPKGYQKLAQQCLSFKASDRPTASQAVIMLRALPFEEDRHILYTV